MLRGLLWGLFVALSAMPVRAARIECTEAALHAEIARLNLGGANCSDDPDAPCSADTECAAGATCTNRSLTFDCRDATILIKQDVNARAIGGYCGGCETCAFSPQTVCSTDPSNPRPCPPGYGACEIHPQTCNDPEVCTGNMRNRIIRASGVVIDGEDRNLTLKLDPPCNSYFGEDSNAPVEFEQGSWAFSVEGDDVTIRNLTISHFSEGIQTRYGGQPARMLLENLTMIRACDDFVGYRAGQGGHIVRNSTFRRGSGKCIQIEGVARDVDPAAWDYWSWQILNNDFQSCEQHLKVGSGRVLVRGNTFRAGDGIPPTGPGFTGGTVYLEDNQVLGLRRGLVVNEIHGSARLIARRNLFRDNELRGLAITDKAKALLEENEFIDNGGGSAPVDLNDDESPNQGGVSIGDQAVVDLGGGRLKLDGRLTTSLGRNSFQGNRSGSAQALDVSNHTPGALPAERNWWGDSDPSDQVLEAPGAVDWSPALSSAPDDCSIVGSICGNGSREDCEACDGTDLGGATCDTSPGYSSGFLACAADCRSFDTSGCVELTCAEKPEYGQPCSAGEGACRVEATFVCETPASTWEEPWCNAFPTSPGIEVCDDAVDNDCDGVTDEDGIGSDPWYRDADADGHGDPNVGRYACDPVPGHMLVAGDCDDTDPAVSPDGTERCGNGKDDDCDGSTDEEGTNVPWYLDADGDGWGNLAISQLACAAPAGYALHSGDCDDAHAAIAPGAPEVCDDILDNDCDGLFDEGCVLRQLEDFSGLPNFSNPPGWFDTGADNSLVQDDSLFTVTAYENNPSLATGSTLTNIHSHLVLDGSEGWSDYEYSGRFRFDHPNAGIGITVYSRYPAADAYYRLRRFGSLLEFHLNHHGTAACQDLLTGVTPEPNRWYRFRLRVESVANGTRLRARVWDDVALEPPWQVDCTDESAPRLVAGRVGLWSMGPGGKRWEDLLVENLPRPTCGDGVREADERCDGSDLEDATCESLGYGGGALACEADCAGLDTSACTGTCQTHPLHGTPCSAGTGGCRDDGMYVCDVPGSLTEVPHCDAVAGAPATEVCDGADNDCDGTTDEPDASGAPTWYPDQDTDGYGAATGGTVACTPPSGFVGNALDCRDNDPAVNPDADEVCRDRLDNDCDGVTDGPGCPLPVCGDTFVDPVEACDDGNTLDGDGCSATCAHEGYGPNALANGDFAGGTAGWGFYSDGSAGFSVVSGEGRVGISVAGANVQVYQLPVAVQGSATYRLRFRARNTGGDDVQVQLFKNASPYTEYAPTTTFNLTPSDTWFTLTFQTTAGDKNDARFRFWLAPFDRAGQAYFFDDVTLRRVTTRCGNGAVEPLEQCDDGNLAAGDGCSPGCRLEAYCGDGTLDPGEQCDDGSANSNSVPDACRTDCTPARCGDAVTDSGEACDGGGATAACDANCTPAVCGDGTLNAAANEQCDDGNVAAGDGCSATCRTEGCGNGVVDVGETCDQGGATAECDSDCTAVACGDGTRNASAAEQCDDGNVAAGDGCSPTCRNEVCGNGIPDPGEACDPGGSDSASCDADCTAVACGDGRRNAVAGEGCDDGNAVSGDGCSSTCQAEATCGDGAVGGAEQCDDGNLVAGDGCSPSCTVEPRCGDGLLATVEACDDGNTLDGDGCSATCAHEGYGPNALANGDFAGGTANWSFYTDRSAGFSVVSGEGRVGISVAGANVQLYQLPVALQGNATYRLRFRARNTGGDDVQVQLFKNVSPYTEYAPSTTFNLTATDTWFTLTFQTTAGDKNDARFRFWLAPFDRAGQAYFFDDVTLRRVTTHCGNGVVEPLEQCDDGNLAAGDGCSPGCRAESICGDGILDSGEQCDAGAANSNTTPDACRTNCTLARCGDAVTDSGESCDGGGATAGCDANCTPAVCGDGTHNAAANEQCDDGNVTSGDGCSDSCRTEGCGNGVVDPGESCDTAGASATCDADCTPVACGDGTQNAEADEQCDDGNIAAGDGCSPTCRTEVCGNSILDPGEACDTGGASATCDPDCSAAACGDGTLNPAANEACDDGNLLVGDGCAANCSVEAGTNVVVNGDFSAGTSPWSFYSNGSASFGLDAGRARIAITTEGSNVQLFQINLSLLGSTRYRLRFKGQNTGGDDVEVVLQKHGSPYTGYGLRRVFDLSATEQSFSFEFTTTAGDKTDARLMFWLAPFDRAGQVYWFDDMVLEKLP